MHLCLNIAAIYLSSCNLIIIHAQYGIGGAYNFGGVLPGNVVPGVPVGGTANVVPGTPINGFPFLNGGFFNGGLNNGGQNVFNANQNSNANSNTNTAQSNSGASAGAGNAINITVGTKITDMVTSPVVVIPPAPVPVPLAAGTGKGTVARPHGVISSVKGVDTVNFDPDQPKEAAFSVANAPRAPPELAVLVGS